MNIYVASSWQNRQQPVVVRALRSDDHEVYDFRNPDWGERGFQWSDISPKWQEWSTAQFKAALQHEFAVKGLAQNKAALDACDAAVLVLPSSRSGFVDLGYACGAKKLTAVLLLEEGCAPELEYGLADFLATDLAEVRKWLKSVKR